MPGLILYLDMRKNRLWADLRFALLCQMCGRTPEEPVLTSCLHIYCKACLKSISDEAAGAALARTKCFKCGTVYQGATDIPDLPRIKSKLGVDVDSETLENENLVERPRRTSQDNIKWCLLKDKVLQSSKSKAVEMQLEEWFQTNPKAKIVVFRSVLASFFEWTPADLIIANSTFCEISFILTQVLVLIPDSMKVLEKICQQNGWKYCTVSA